MDISHLSQIKGISLYDPCDDAPYMRMEIAPDSAFGLRDVFICMVNFSSKRQSRPVICWNFMPGFHLHLKSDWNEQRHGISTLAQDWGRVSASMEAWNENWGDTHNGCQIQMKHGYAVAARAPCEEFFDQLAMKITRLS
ncbi:hypothetical protein AAKU55_004726 [Oxalobacteraceae bacterium GrIS 1.11]